MAERRPERVAHLVQAELARWLLREAGDPRLQQVTITDVRMSPDLRLARVYERPRHEEWTPDALDFMNALAALPTRMRACVVLFYCEDLPTAHVAETLGCSPRTVENHLRAARQRLAGSLGIEPPSADVAVGESARTPL